MSYPRHFEMQNRTLAREVSQISTMLAELERAVQILDADIAAEEQRTGISDRTNFAYPTTAQDMIARRDNLKTTISVLTSRLSRSDATPLLAS